MTSPIEHATELKAQADDLLRATGLVESLTRRGAVSFTGSYSYELMTWRDVDVCLAIREEPMRVAAEIVSDVATIPNLATVYIRNELVLRTEGNPQAVFVCLEFQEGPQGLWKVDVLLGSPELVATTVAPGRALAAKLTASTRAAILEIKSVLCRRRDYRREIKSTDIYRAVLDDGVRDLEGWEEWWRRRRSAGSGGQERPHR